MNDEASFNRQRILEYFDLLFDRHEPEIAAKEYLNQNYIHHGPGCESSVDGFVRHFAEYFAACPAFTAVVCHCIAEGSFVALRVETKLPPDQLGHSTAEFYRLENGKISEHWHVVEATQATTLFL